jgi:hypothetical protein
VTLWELIFSPLAQDPVYHLFADSRTLLAIPNFWNVVSNLPFVGVGGWGLLIAFREGPGPVRMAWQIVFVGVVLTGLGSGWYHLTPDNPSLFWDRLAMMIGFMALTAVVLGEYVAPRLATSLLLPLLIVGTTAVYYWIHTESQGSGDLRPYALAQFVPALVLPVVVILNRERSALGKYFFVLFLCYALAKAAEVFDHEVYAAGQLLSGHTLKHLLAAAGLAALALGLARRQRG